jgi:hypothetical protein
MPGDGTKKRGGDEREGASRSSPHPVSRLAPPFDLVDAAREIVEADRVLGAVVGNELELIVDQIRALQDRAREILERAKRDKDLHRATCAFKKRAGHVYHLYERADGSLYFSMLSPDEWGAEPPHAFRGSYRLEADMSWTPAGEIEERDRARATVTRLLGSGD